MHVRIGVLNNPRELDVEMNDDIDMVALKADVDAALGGGLPVLWLTDRKGVQTGVPTSQIAWVQVGNPAAEPKIGFGN